MTLGRYRCKHIYFPGTVNGGKTVISSNIGRSNSGITEGKSAGSQTQNKGAAQERREQGETIATKDPLVERRRLQRVAQEKMLSKKYSEDI